MSGFTALNVEPEDEVTEDIDDTREIQLEEALKLYQNALKLHSQGFEYSEQAGEAYKELFKCEVFQYPDAVSEFNRDELDNDTEETPSALFEPELDILPSTSSQASPSSLPQILYLAFKNYGQFLLEKHHHDQAGNSTDTTASADPLAQVCAKALKQFAEALERDDTDLDLWRKGARVAHLCASDRIVRFCLESVLAGDDEGSNEVVEILGLEEALAATQLRDMTVALQDDLSQIQSTTEKIRSGLQGLLRASIDPFPYLPPSDQSLAKRHLAAVRKDSMRHVLKPFSGSWLGVGQALLQSLSDEQASYYQSAPGQPVLLELPDDLVCLDSPVEDDISDSTASLRSPSPTLDDTTTIEETVLANGKEQQPGEKSALIEQPTDEDVAEDQPQPGQDNGMQGEEAEAQTRSRKRSAASAGHESQPDNGRSKSKRLRNRESNADAILQDEDAANNTTAHYDDQLREIAEADEELFRNARFLCCSYLLSAFDTLESLRGRMATDQYWIGGVPPAEYTNMHDLRASLTSWSEEKAHAVATGHKSSSFGGEKAGLTLFHEHSKTTASESAEVWPLRGKRDLSDFIHACNKADASRHQAAFLWVEALISPTVSPTSAFRSSTYIRTLWPEDLKTMMVQVISRIDDVIYQNMRDRLMVLEERRLLSSFAYTSQDLAHADMALTLYELYLDIYSSITNPSSQVGMDTRLIQWDRLQRWSELAASFINIYADHEDESTVREWHIIRYIWTATTHANKAQDVSQEHVMVCLQHLRKLLKLVGDPIIFLPNNAEMPEISADAVEQEISRASTLEFFTNIFNDDSKDPWFVIESLDPILEPDMTIDESLMPPRQLELIVFLDAGKVTLRLFLWRRLLEAYTAINYVPKIVSCHLRSIEAILSVISSESHQTQPSQARELELLKWIKELDEHITEALTKILNHPNPFETFDHRHLFDAMKSIASLCRYLHSFAFWEDSVRVGQISEPKKRKSLDGFRDRLRDMYVKVWTLNYTLLKEAIVQKMSRAHEGDPFAWRAEYLDSLHRALGLRGYCKQANKLFLKVLKAELMDLGSQTNCTAEMAQVLFDLHDLRLMPGVYDADHGCPPEPLDKKSAAYVAEAALVQAGKMSMKDLLRSDLKTAIEQIQQALGSEKLPAAVLANRRVITAYLRSPISQIQLFRASRGEGILHLRPTDSENAKLASRGWYSMLGHLSLAKFKSIKRINVGPVDDLDAAIGFFKQDLEHDAEKWETWYRLAQVFDAKIEEDLSWNADKVNNHRSELAALQRSAIHCYEMAMSVAIRSADDLPETAIKLSEMYSAFATRLYASTRDPLSMEAFDNSFNQRHFSRSGEQSPLYQGASTPSMPMFSVWRLAAHLLGRALVERPRDWMNHYLLGKCLWKMLNTPDPFSRRKVQIDEVLDAFTEAIDCLPQRKDSRTDPVLEPHFKLVSVVHKLVQQKMLIPARGSEILQATQYARDIHLDEDEDGWEPYILDILKKLGHADKSNWHHRIIARAAHVIYDDQQNITAALGAKHEFTQQIFTKTMTLQVWKPEHERAGRHFVYTSRYVLFFVKLLNQLNDRASMDQLIRRIRRKQSDYLNHQQIWEQVVTSYIDLLRRLSKVPSGHDEAFYRTISYGDFVLATDEYEVCAMKAANSNLILEIMRDALELKKINNSLMKGSLIEELMIDCYALNLQAFIVENRSQGRFLTNPQDKSIPLLLAVDDRSRERMKLGSILAGQTDGQLDPSQKTNGTTQPIALSMQAPTAKPAKMKIITRRELQRKAEGLVVRPPPIKTPTLLKHSLFTRRTSADGTPSGKPRQSSVGEDSGDAINGDDAGDDGLITRESSRPGSVHDSADDESELSELDDADGLDGLDDNSEEDSGLIQGDRNQNFKSGVLFPGLLKRPENGVDDSSAVVSDSEDTGDRGVMDVDE